jgi:hypothetical protein
MFDFLVLISVIIAFAIAMSRRSRKRWVANRYYTPTPPNYYRRTSSFRSSTHISNSHFDNLSEHKSNRISTYRQSSHSNLIENKSLTPIEKAREDIQRLSESIQKYQDENNKLERRVTPITTPTKSVSEPVRSTLLFPFDIGREIETETVTESVWKFERRTVTRRISQ